MPPPLTESAKHESVASEPNPDEDTPYDTKLQEPGNSVKEPQDLGYARGRFIVKFKSQGEHSVEACAHCLFSTRTEFQNYTASGSNSIDQLNQRFKIKGVKSLLRKRHGLTTYDAQSYQSQRYQNVLNQFPARTARVPQNVKMPDLTNVYMIEVSEEQDIAELCQQYEADPHVEYAQPDYRMELFVFPATPPNDTHYSELWGLNNTGQTGGTVDADIDAPEAWAEAGSSFLGDGILVAVVDTGVDYTHTDLAANIWINPGEDINANDQYDLSDENNVDDDGNGLVDDIRGYDFTMCTQGEENLGLCTVKDRDNDPFDGHDHGTHVSGTIAAIGDNSTGIIGVAPNAKIMPIKGLLDVGFGFTSDLAEGILYAAEQGADVINNSWGCSRACPSDPVSEDVIEVAFALGSVVVFSAGNSNLDVNDFSPQNMTNTVTVASTDHDDAKSSFSNFGVLVDVAAPGSSVLSTIPGDQYNFFSGTSMAAPHVSGLSALILSHHKSKYDFTNAQVEIVLRGTSDNIGLSLMGDGRINANAAMTLLPVEPVITVAANETATEGTTKVINVTATDPDLQTLTLIAAMTNGNNVTSIGATFSDNGAGAGTLTWTPAANQAGIYFINFTATDIDGFFDTEMMTITVSANGVCGNGTIEAGEQCDDSNTINNDGCSSECIDETTSCGDGVKAGLEECDDHNITDGDGCSSTCTLEQCGNNTTDSGETCDDGNAVSGDGCSSTCQTEVCGNSVIDLGEQCDDGNTTDEDNCSSGCQLEVCGDGILQTGLGETCDDGNVTRNDGCSPTCIIEIPGCGDRLCQPDETCSDCPKDCGTCRGGSRPRPR